MSSKSLTLLCERAHIQHENEGLTVCPKCGKVNNMETPPFMTWTKAPPKSCNLVKVIGKPKMKEGKLVVAIQTIQDSLHDTSRVLPFSELTK